MITLQLNVMLQAMMSTLTKMKSLMQQQIRMRGNARLFNLVEARVGGHECLDFIIGEGS